MRAKPRCILFGLLCVVNLFLLSSCGNGVQCFDLSVNLPENFVSEPLKEAYVAAFSTRRYCVKVGWRYDETGSDEFPLVILFHSSLSGALPVMNNIQTFADRYNLIIVSLDGNLYEEGSSCSFYQDQICWPTEIYGHTFFDVNSTFDVRGESVNADIPFVRALIDRIKQDYRVDDSRVYMVGTSIGAFATYFMAKQFSTEVRAIASIAGGIYLSCPNPSDPDCNMTNDFYYPGVPTGPFNFCDVAGCPVPGDGIHAENKFAALVVHGREDPSIPFVNAELAVDQLQAEGHYVETLFLDGEGHIISFRDHFPDIWSFFRSLD